MFQQRGRCAGVLPSLLLLAALGAAGCRRPVEPAPSSGEEGLAAARTASGSPRALAEKEFYPTGALAIERVLATDAEGVAIRHGDETTWYKNGAKRSVAPYRNGVLEGTYTIWHIDGWKLSESRFEAGKRHGSFQRWYSDGTLQRHDEYVDGLPSGSSTTWHPNGRKRSEGRFEGGAKNGEWRFWDAHGKLLRTENWVAGALASSEPPAAP